MQKWTVYSVSVVVSEMTKYKKIFGSEKDANIFDVNVKTGTARILKTEIAAVVYHENGADIHMKSGTIFQVIN
jgi:hypothetical protein